MNALNPESRKKVPKWKKILTEHKLIVVGGLIGAIALAGIISGIVILTEETDEKRDTFIFSLDGGLESIDPLNVYYADWNSRVLTQIVEPLFTLEWSGDHYENVPYLAKNYEWSEDGLNLTCHLRKGIKFHDGSPFNATAIKWNFDRIHRLLDDMDIPYYGYPFIWYHADDTLILNKTIVLDDHIVRFVLNKPYVPFIALLTTIAAHIVSPTSTPADRFLNTLNEKLIGTGPYIYESNIPNENTTIVANHNYWGKPKPKIEKFVFLYMDWASDDSITNNSKRILSGESDYAWGLINHFENYSRDQSLIVTSYANVNIEYLGMNNIGINVTMRKAISYALNYTYIAEKRISTTGTNVTRLKSPISKGLLYSNWTAFDIPIYNISKARQSLIDGNWPGTASLSANDNITFGNEWEMLANGPNPLAKYNISYIFGLTGSGWYLSNLTLIVKENIKQIGVNVEIIPRTRDDYYANCTSDTLWWSRYWWPDYNDPATNINALFSSKNDGFANDQHTNDTYVQQWMDEALIETDEMVRKELYYKIQERLIEEVYPMAWLFSTIQYDVWKSDSRGWENLGNWMNKISGVLKYFYFV